MDAPQNILRWEAPPPPKTGRHSRTTWIDKAIAEIRKNPDKWALVCIRRHKNAASNSALMIRRRAQKKGIGARVEATSRVLPDKRGAVYARWIEE